MYATCLFCNSALGRNESIEHFPVGRRLAFDAAKGRLWVVCPRCSRWNLTPLDARWEAIEEAERAYRDTKLRAATDNVGLARLREGTELVRIGRPMLPEFAAWRYGNVFGRRRIKAQVGTGASVAVVLAYYGTTLGGATALGLSTATVGLAGSLYSFWMLAQLGYSAQRRVLVRGDDHRIRRLTNADAARSELIQHADLMSWSLRVYHRRRFGKGRVWQSFTTGRLDDMDATSLELTGDLARRAFAAIIPAVNQAGATKAEVRDAVELVVSGAADPVASLVAGVTGAHSRMLTGGVFTLQSIAPAQRLALEMSLHEADERAALEGELHVLEARWREAEEIAAISDGMFLPSDIDERLDRLRGR